MFGKKRELESRIAELELERKVTELELRNTISDLKKTISELEQQLSAERSDHEADKMALQELQGRIEAEDRTYAELQDELRQRIQEFDEKARKHENEMTIERKNLEYEQAQKRLLFEQELEQRRRQEEVAIQKCLQVFSNSYNQYLTQIQPAFGGLNDASIQIGKTFLQKDSEPFFTMRADAPAEK